MPRVIVISGILQVQHRRTRAAHRAFGVVGRAVRSMRPCKLAPRPTASVRAALGRHRLHDQQRRLQPLVPRRMHRPDATHSKTARRQPFASTRARHARRAPQPSPSPATLPRHRPPRRRWRRPPPPPPLPRSTTAASATGVCSGVEMLRRGRAHGDPHAPADPVDHPQRCRHAAIVSPPPARAPYRRRARHSAGSPPGASRDRASTSGGQLFRQRACAVCLGGSAHFGAQGVSRRLRIEQLRPRRAVIPPLPHVRAS